MKWFKCLRCLRCNFPPSFSSSKDMVLGSDGTGAGCHGDGIAPAVILRFAFQHLAWLWLKTSENHMYYMYYVFLHGIIHKHQWNHDDSQFVHSKQLLVVRVFFFWLHAASNLIYWHHHRPSGWFSAPLSQFTLVSVGLQAWCHDQSLVAAAYRSSCCCPFTWVCVGDSVPSMRQTKQLPSVREGEGCIQNTIAQGTSQKIYKWVKMSSSLTRPVWEI